MSATVLTERSAGRAFADTALNVSAHFWFVVTVIGQWLFATYVALAYGGAAVRGDMEAWNRILPHGYVPGQTMSNTAIAVHLLLAVLILVGGPLQLIPRVRSQAPTLHRWIGRFYIPAVFVTALSGVYMVSKRHGVGGAVQQYGILLDAILIMIFSVLSLRYALARDLRAHRRWALRMFLVVSGVWFFRVGLMFWIFINRGPAGFDPKTFLGPFLDFLSFADYLLPLFVLEIYLRTKERGSANGRLAMAAVLFLLTIATGIGIFAATLGMWLPRLR